MERGEPEHPGERALEEREALDDLRVTRLDGAAPAGRYASRAWRWGLRLGGLVALLSLIAIAAVALGPLLSPLVPRPAPSKAAPLDITTLRLPEGVRSCVVDGAWSPDSAQVALVRDSACDTSATQPSPNVMIFNGATGKLLSAFPLDATLLEGVRGDPTMRAAGAYRVGFERVAWEPDDIQIAILFTVFPIYGSGATAFGLALLTVRGVDTGAMSAWTNTPSAYTPSGPLTLTGPHTVAEWDIQEGHRTLTVTPAYAYRWGADGSLEPVAPPTAQSASADLAGGFSMWRSGRIWAVNALTCDNGVEKLLSQPYIALNLSTLAWSPDGRYVTQVSVNGRYDTPGAPTQTTQEPQSTPSTCGGGQVTPDQLPLAPIHDAGLRAALTLAASGGNVSVELEWRPDGQRLAALTFNIAGTGSAIVIYDCRTGAPLRRYTAGQFPINGLPGTGPAKNFDTVFTGGSWSPDGRRLLIEASGTGAAPFILGPGALGA